jgi:hypothetical protein
MNDGKGLGDGGGNNFPCIRSRDLYSGRRSPIFVWCTHILNSSAVFDSPILGLTNSVVVLISQYYRCLNKLALFVSVISN